MFKKCPKYAGFLLEEIANGAITFFGIAYSYQRLNSSYLGRIVCSEQTTNEPLTHP
jgi:hypothetical protein